MKYRKVKSGVEEPGYNNIRAGAEQGWLYEQNHPGGRRL